MYVTRSKLGGVVIVVHSGRHALSSDRIARFAPRGVRRLIPWIDIWAFWREAQPQHKVRVILAKAMTAGNWSRIAPHAGIIAKAPRAVVEVFVGTDKS